MANNTCDALGAVIILPAAKLTRNGDEEDYHTANNPLRGTAHQLYSDDEKHKRNVQQQNDSNGNDELGKTQPPTTATTRYRASHKAKVLRGLTVDVLAPHNAASCLLYTSPSPRDRG